MKELSRYTLCDDTYDSYDKAPCILSIKGYVGELKGTICEHCLRIIREQKPHWIISNVYIEIKMPRQLEIETNQDSNIHPAGV